MSYAEYLRDVEKLPEHEVDYQMRNFTFYAYFQFYLVHCKEHGLAHQRIEDIVFAKTW